MQKKLIALAVAGLASSAAFAQSNVTIYGLIQPSYDFIDTDTEHKTTRLSDNNSRIGFKGEEALGNGLKAIFQIESGVSVGSSRDDAPQSGVFGGRDTWVGLAGNFGSLTFGKHQTAYKKVADPFDPFADSIGDYNNIMGGIGYGQDEFNARRSGSAYYTSPSWSGFQVLASYALNGMGDGDGIYSQGDKDDNTYSLAASYTNGGLNLIAGYESTDLNAGNAFGADSIDGWKLGAGYKFSFGTKVGLIYENIEAGDFDTDHVYVYAAHPITSNIDLMASYIDASGSTEVGGDARNFNLGVDYKFSKRTSVQAFYTNLDNDDNGTYGLDSGYSAGANTYDADGELVALSAGRKVSGFSVRLRHAF